MSASTEDLAKLAASGRMIRNGRTRRALIARLLSEQAEGSDEEGDEDTAEDGGDDDRQLVKALLGSRMLKRRRLRRVLLAHLIRERGASEGDDEVDEYDEDEGEEETGDDDRKLLRLVLGSRILRKRRVRRALLARLIKQRSGGGDVEEFDDDVDEDEGEDDVGEEGGDRERKFLRLLVGSRILRKRRVRRALLAKLLSARGGAAEEGEDDLDDGEDEDAEEGPDLERQVARLLVGRKVVRRRRTRKVALARFLRNRD